MQTGSSKSSWFANWFKKNTEGTLQMQWISYFMIFSVLVIFIIQYPTTDKLDWRFFATVLSLGATMVINILWFQYHEQQFVRQHTLFYQWTFNIVTSLLVLAAFAFTGTSEIVFLLFMQVAQFASIFGVWPNGAIYSAVSLGSALGILKAYNVPSRDLVQIAAEFMTGMIFVLVFVLL